MPRHGSMEVNFAGIEAKRCVCVVHDFDGFGVFKIEEFVDFCEQFDNTVHINQTGVAICCCCCCQNAN